MTRTVALMLCLGVALIVLGCLTGEIGFGFCALGGVLVGFAMVEYVFGRR